METRIIKEKYLIIMNGNVCSGKTTIAHKLAQALRFSLLSIDNYRMIWNPQVDQSGENLAWDVLRDDIMQIDRIREGYPGIVLDSTGLSKNIQDLYYYDKSFVVKIVDSPESCLRRLKLRALHTNYVYELIFHNGSQERSIHRLDALLASQPYDYSFVFRDEADAEVINIVKKFKEKFPNFERRNPDEVPPI